MASSNERPPFPVNWHSLFWWARVTPLRMRRDGLSTVIACPKTWLGYTIADQRMNATKKTLLFSAIGFGLSALIAELANLAPNVFGWLTLPFWLLPAVANLGAHDVAWPLFAASGAICYGGAAFLVSLLWRRRNAGR